MEHLQLLLALLQKVGMFLVTMGILVTIHEFGHFVVARWSGVKILRFSVGFGRPLFRRPLRDGSEFVIAAIPLGGYVRMLDERDVDPALGNLSPEDAARSFNRLSPGWRIAIAIAGPGANLLLAVFAYWLVFMVGIRDMPPIFGTPAPQSIAAAANMPTGARVTSVDGVAVAGASDVVRELANRLGESGEIVLAGETRDGRPEVWRLPVRDWQKGVDEPDIVGSLGLRIGFLVGELSPDGAATRAGLQRGDDVLAIDGVALDGWEAFHRTVRASAGKTLTLDVRRDGRELQITLVPARVPGPDGKPMGLAGVAPYVVQVTHGPFAAVPLAVERMVRDVGNLLSAVGKIVTGAVSTRNLSGPLTIAQVASDSAEVGYEYYVSVLAMLSVGLAVLNLLPVPVLDGGHVVYASVELVTGRAVPERVQLVGLQIGLAFVASLTVLALYNDVMRLLPVSPN
jgi:regulator of sigma E protease